ncbi:hypothetical protein [Bifidobacterium leontopitheci]|uniref:Uncharacterized protein n=1 Tax=Bifidobacterium leontopitheci TaxID=2650774 RepID=A0A6I1GDF6_9BIFI|nr:hypothetical protein [Bifidobacterium leontopitheci]KAB7789670.1 hypothetical protein F7D09_1804 [Bifidobacterium leontopitheci]
MSFSEAPVLWIVWIILLALCGGAAIAGLVVGIRVAKERKAGAGDDAEVSGPADGSAASAGTMYISGTFGGGRPVAWTGRKALDAALSCGATYIGLIQGDGSSVTTVSSGWGRERVSGTDGLAQAAAKFHVPVPTQVEPFSTAYDRAILTLMDRPLYGHHVRVYLLRYAEPYEGTQYDAPRHRNLYALVVALDAGLPGTVESTLTRVDNARSFAHFGSGLG